jgi:hypothetical protein
MDRRPPLPGLDVLARCGLRLTADAEITDHVKEATISALSA